MLDSPLFSPFDLGPLRLRNRLVKAATYEGLCPGGLVSPELIELHRAVARGGIGLSTVAYAAVSGDGRTYDRQLLLDDQCLPGLQALAAAIRGEGAAAAIQIGHSGDFADPRVSGSRAIGPSRRFDTYHLGLARAMGASDFARVEGDFARGAGLAREAGFDAVELHLGHGYLLSQFVSPWTNRRRDEYGGSLANRLRFPLAVIAAVRGALGDSVALVIKMNLEDGFPGGLAIDEAVAVAAALEEAGAHALALSGGFVSRAPLHMLRGEVPVAAMAAVQTRLHARLGLRLFGRLFVAQEPYSEAFFLPLARQVRQAVRLPLMLLGGLKRRAVCEQALGEGFALVGLGRALVHDPALPRKWRSGERDDSDCVPCNECIAEMDRGFLRCTRTAAPESTSR